MPELPEVETIVRGLQEHLAGSVIADATELRTGMIEGNRQRFDAAVPGALIERVRRRAKLVVCDLKDAHGQSSESLIFHLKMSGSLMVRSAETPPGPHTRVLFTLADGRRLFFDDIRTFGYCRLLNDEEKKTWPVWATLGPEPLDLAPRDFADCFSHSGRAVKAMLLDQRVIAGIGNIYADESLFRAHIHPATAAAALTTHRLARLHDALRAVLLEAIDQCGSSIRNYRDANGNAGAFQNSFRVYGRAGKPCVCCKTPLAAMRIAGRATVFCPVCQKVK